MAGPPHAQPMQHQLLQRLRASGGYSGTRTPHAARNVFRAIRNIAAVSRAARRAAQALVQAGDLEAATAVLESSITAHARDDAHYAPDHLNLAFMEARLGKVDQALAHLAAARRADPAYVRTTLPRMAQAAHADPAMSPAFLAALDGGPR